MCIHVKKTYVSILLIILPVSNLIASTNTNCIHFDSLIHDFGDICISDGPQIYVFTLTNDSDSEFRIASVATSCGCISVNWEKGIIRPNEHALIEVTYKNLGSNPQIDEVIYIYTTLKKTPEILRVTGSVLSKHLPFRKLYPFMCGNIGLKNSSISLGTVEQNADTSDGFRVFNFSNMESSIHLESPIIRFEQSSYSIPPRSSAFIPFSFTAPTYLIGFNSTPIYITNLSSDIKEKVVLYADFQVISKCHNNQVERSIKLANKYINLGPIINEKDRFFSFKILNLGAVPLSVYKIETPPHIIQLSRILSMKVDSTMTIPLKVMDTKHTKNAKVAKVAVYTDSRQAVDYLYVSYYIPSCIELFFLKAKFYFIKLWNHVQLL